MGLRSLTRPFTDAGDSAKEAVGTKVDEVKLRIVRSLSSLFASFLSTLIVIVFVLTAVAFLGVALGHWIGSLLGSPAMGFLLIGALFALVTIILLCFKSKLFINNFIRKFIAIFFPDDDE
ncbi:MAG: hypothetical protein J6Z27_04010 [Bacteroidales bacterium]|nr:hypothetical protein [Bacteroidales bacterium]